MVKLFLFFLIFANAAFACPNEEFQTWMNSDGSTGGKVSILARVSPEVYIAPEAMICGRAWVDGDVKLYDQSSILGDVWVGPFVTLSGSSIISEKASVRGKSLQHRAVIKDRAKIRGQAKIYGNAVIQDDAIVEGHANLDSYVVVSNSAKVCENLRLENIEISDNRFCLEGAAASKAIIEVNGLTRESYNSASSIVRFNFPTGYILAHGTNQALVTINDIPIIDNDMTVWSDRVRVKIENYTREGLNNLTYKFIDQFGDIISESFEFYIGSNQLSIPLIVEDGTSASKLVAKAFIWEEGRRLPVSSYISDDYDLVIKGLPSLENLKVSVLLIGQNSASINNFFANSAPENILIETFPLAQIEENLDFSLGLEGWEHGGNGDIDVELVDERNKLVLTPTSQGQVYAKAIVIDTFGQGVMTSQLIFSKDGDEGQIASVLLYNLRKKSFEFAQMEKKQGRSSLVHPMLDEVLKDDKVFVLYEITTFSSTKQMAPVETEGTDEKSLEASFQTIAITKPAGNSVDYASADPVLNGCASNTQTLDSTMFAPFEYLSTGTFPAYGLGSNPQRNRIYGTIIINTEIHDLDDVRLEIIEGTTSKVASVPLSDCAKKKLREQLNGRRKEISITSNFNKEANYLFELGVVATADTASPLLLKVTDVTNPTLKTIQESSAIEVIQLRDYDFEPSTQLYSERDRYDSNKPTLSRAGGDTWGMEVYRQVWHELLPILNFFGETWKANDFAIINGARYRKGEKDVTHRNGQDADFQFNGYVSDKPTTQNEFDKGKRIYNSLAIADGDFSKIRDIYLEPADVTGEMVPSGEIESGLWKSLAHRCISNRVIDPFVSGNGKGSLIIGRDKHKDHMHIRLHAHNNNEVRILPQREVSFDLSDFLFKLEDRGDKYELHTQLRNPLDHPNAGDYRIAVRLQSDDVETATTKMFLHSDTLIQPQNEAYYWSVTFPKGSVPNEIEMKHVKFVVWDTKTADATNFPGGCKQFDFTLDIASLCKVNNEFQEWYFHKNDDDTYAVVAYGNTVNSSYVQSGSKVCGEHVTVSDSDIRAVTHLSNHIILTKDKSEDSLTVSNLAIQDPSLKKRTSEDPFVTINADGSIMNLSLQRKTEVSGWVNFVDVTVDLPPLPALDDDIATFSNNSSASEMQIVRTDFESGYPRLTGSFSIIDSTIKGDVQLNACGEVLKSGECGDGEIVLLDVTIDSAGISNVRDFLEMDVMSATTIYMSETTIIGRPEFKEGLVVSGSIIEGDGSYIGSKAGATDINGDPYLSVMSNHYFKGDNNFNGRFALNTNMEDCTVSNNSEIVLAGGDFQFVLVEGEMSGKWMHNAELKGHIHISGEVSSDLKMDSTVEVLGNLYLNSFVFSGSLLLGSEIDVSGPIGIWQGGELVYHNSGPKIINVDRVPTTGLHSTIRANSYVRDVDLSGAFSVVNSTVIGGEIKGSNNSVNDSTLNNVNVRGASCIMDRNWSNITVYNYSCSGPAVTNSRLDTASKFGMEKHRETMNELSRKTHELIKSFRKKKRRFSLLSH